MKLPQGWDSDEPQAHSTICTGALIAPRWVLTAAHCVANLGNPTVRVLDATRVTIEVGRVDKKRRGEEFTAARIIVGDYRAAPSRTLDDDIALIELSSPSPATPLWILPSAAAAPEDAPLVLYGYGITVPASDPTAKHDERGILRRTVPGANTLWYGCPAATGGRACARDTMTSVGYGGDSGGPWTVQVDGTPMLAMIFTGYVDDPARAAQWQYGEVIADDETLSWVRQATGVAELTPGHVVRDSATGQAWLVDTIGFRHKIQDGGTYLCLVDHGAVVDELTRAAIDSTPERTAPAQCDSGAPERRVIAWGGSPFGETSVPPGLTATSVAAGLHHSLALRADGTVTSWGANFYGEGSVPAGLSDVIALQAADVHSLALKRDGTVVAWGASPYGETAVPADLTDVTAIASGGGARHNLALKRDGTVVAWGANFYGERTVPEGLSDVVAVAANGVHSLALKRDGTVVAWGSNFFGESTVPAGLNNVVAIAAGHYHSVALRRDGSVVQWGAYTRFDFSTGQPQAIQADIPATATNIVAIATGTDHTMALRADGSVIAWGYNPDGRATVPTDVVGAAMIAAGGPFSVALLN